MVGSYGVEASLYSLCMYVFLSRGAECRLILAAVGSLALRSVSLLVQGAHRQG